jgi:hypothetical protein
MFDRLKFYRHPVREEELSAHLDGCLPPDRARRLEEHLRSCDSCRRKLADLRALAAALREMPDAPLPRSFALTPEQVRGVRPVRPHAPVGRLYPVFRNAAAAALLLLFAFVGADIFIESGGGPSEPQGSMIGAQKSMAVPSVEGGAAADQEKSERNAFGANEATPVPGTEGLVPPGVPVPAAPETPLPGAESTPLLVLSPTAWGTPVPGAGLIPPPYPVPAAPETPPSATTLTPLPSLALTAPETPSAAEAARPAAAAAPEEEGDRLWLRVLEGVLGGLALGLLAVALFLRRRSRRA